MLVALTSSTLSFSTSIQRHLFGRLQCAIGPCLGTCSEVYQFRKERCLISSWLTIHWHIWIHPWDIRSYNFKDLTQHGMMFDDHPGKGTSEQPVQFQNAWMEQRPRSSSMAHWNAVQMSLLFSLAMLNFSVQTSQERCTVAWILVSLIF